MYDEG
jgi:hypothetical protein